MDNFGRESALELLGVDGVRVRDEIPLILADCHDRMANAQAEAAMSHTGPYGYIWKKAMEEFVARLGLLPSAEFVKIPRSYKLVSFNGVVIFPWRFAREADADPLANLHFAVSGGRISVFEAVRSPQLDRLPIEFDHPELTEDEIRQVTEAQAAAFEQVASTGARTIVVAYSSNPSALHSIFWGEAQLNADGYLVFERGEYLKATPPADLVDVNADGDTFADGAIPRPVLEAKADGTSGAE